MNKITKADVGEDLWEIILDDFECHSMEEHRRGSNFFTKTIFHIDETVAPDRPDLHGFWESNRYINDAEYGRDNDEITTLTRVRKVEKTITVEAWEPVE